MADTWNYIPPPIDVGSAQDYMGQVGGYNIGTQPTFTAPDVSAYVPPQSFAPTETGYTPTFDFSSYMPSAPTYTTFGAGGQAQQLQDPFANVPVGGAAAQVPFNQFVGPGASTVPFPIPRPADLGGFQAGPTQTPTTPEDIATQQDAAKRLGVEPTDQGGLLQNLLGKGFSTSDALKLALGLGGGLMGMSAQKKAADEAAAAEAEYKAAAAKAAGQYQGLAQPYLTAGGSQLSMALQGSLSPAQMQQFQAAQAQLAQGAERTGGVGSIQSAAALENIRQQALQNQQNMALQLLGPGNQLASNAITTELQGTQGGLQLGLNLAQQANAASMNMYSAIAQMMGGQRSSSNAA